MLLNEFLKEHRKVQELEATVVQQKKGYAGFRGKPERADLAN